MLEERKNALSALLLKEEEDYAKELEIHYRFIRYHNVCQPYCLLQGGITDRTTGKNAPESKRASR